MEERFAANSALSEGLFGAAQARLASLVPSKFPAVFLQKTKPPASAVWFGRKTFK
jgi:hypothetical protein